MRPERIIQPFPASRKGLRFLLRIEYLNVQQLITQLPIERFDIAEDPGELNDLADDPSRAGLCRQLHERVLEGWSGDEIETAMEHKEERYDELAARAHKTAEKDFWDMPPGCIVFPQR